MRIVFFAGLLLGTLAVAGAQEKQSDLWSTSNSMTIASISASRVFSLSNAKHKTATIDFDGDAVRYSGDLPVDEGAKIFFDAVLRQMKHCEVKQP